ncbi:FAD:protein FMN transferase [bacterium]|nr:FAD:protein FMN transferase [bacterium]
MGGSPGKRGLRRFRGLIVLGPSYNHSASNLGSGRFFMPRRGVVSGLIASGVVLSLALASCGPEEPKLLEYQLEGPAQGTTYSIRYTAPPQRDVQRSVDSVFLAIDAELSAWNPTSSLSRLNRGESLKPEEHPLLKAVLDSAAVYFKPTGGRFNLAVGPLVRLWGFYQKNPGAFPDSAAVDSVRALCGPNRLSVVDGHWVLKPGSSLDVNGIAQGYTVDVLCALLERRGIRDYFVEVGGELRTSGQTIDGRVWSIGIDRPVQPDPGRPDQPAERVLQRIFPMSGRALATSGNYRNFRYDPATRKRYGHSIDPESGYPKETVLLSASVVVGNCTKADAWATALMVAGLDEAKRLALTEPGLEVYLIFLNPKGEFETWETPGFELEE